MTMMRTVSILHYSAETKRFSSNIVVKDNVQDQDDHHSSVLSSSAEIVPSHSWLSDYQSWNVFGGLSHPPTFQSLAELQEFNEKGFELTSRLQKELHFQDDVEVEPYCPIFLRVSVGGKACGGWWHLRDEHYGFPINLQRIPISDTLKSDFRGWFIKVERWAWLEQTKVREELNLEVSTLQDRLQHELNSSQDEFPAMPEAIVIASE